GADLRGAKLCRANLHGADLSHADLRGADLLGVNWKKTLLDGTQFDKEPASTEDPREREQDTSPEVPEQRLARAVLHAATLPHEKDALHASKMHFS
ncbi:MAG TPA: pentapeptide repeat-containing protein, partial [Ktedonobacteraceae bacterium]|nr:pentapeptide repeat-containing protein [Ktedonobacteraceae bacterium]